MRAIRETEIRNCCSFCRYNIASHLHIPQPLKLQSLQQLRARSAYLISFLQIQQHGVGACSPSLVTVATLGAARSINVLQHSPNA